MELKEMSNQELLAGYASGHKNYCEFGEEEDLIIAQNCEAELLSRLEDGEKAIEIVDELHASFTIETPQHLCDMVIEFVKRREGIK